jgi:hypothetical protein
MIAGYSLIRILAVDHYLIFCGTLTDQVGISAPVTEEITGVAS